MFYKLIVMIILAVISLGMTVSVGLSIQRVICCLGRFPPSKEEIFQAFFQAFF